MQFVSNGALGGSTNAVIHLIAIAGTSRRAHDPRGLGPHRARHSYAGGPSCLPDRFLMEDFYYAGGSSGCRPNCWRNTDYCMKARSRLREKTITENCLGRAELERRGDSTRGEAAGRAWRPIAGPARQSGLRMGPWLKPSAASPHLMKHRGTCGRGSRPSSNTMSGFWTLISTLTRIP